MTRCNPGSDYSITFTILYLPEASWRFHRCIQGLRIIPVSCMWFTESYCRTGLPQSILCLARSHVPPLFRYIHSAPRSLKVSFHYILSLNLSPFHFLSRVEFSHIYFSVVFHSWCWYRVTCKVLDLLESPMGQLRYTISFHLDIILCWKTLIAFVKGLCEERIILYSAYQKLPLYPLSML